MASATREISIAAPLEPEADPIAEDARRLWQLRGRLSWRSALHQLRQSWLRVAVLVLLTAIFWAIVFGMFYEGFRLFQSMVADAATRAEFVRLIYNLYFVALMLMLSVSSAIILYGGLYRSEDVPILLTMPVDPGELVLFKFYESVLVSGWGFIVLGSPMLIAHGIVDGAPWYYYLFLAPLLVAFVFIPAAAGAILCLATVYYLPRFRFAALGLVVAGGVAAAVVAGVWIFRTDESGVLGERWLQHILARMEFVEQRVFPSWWLSKGLLEASQPLDDSSGWTQSLWFLSLLATTAVVATLSVGWVGRALFRESYSRLQGLVSPQTHAGGAWIDRLVDAALQWLAPPMRLLLVKDFRVLRRDLVQWGQLVIFFGLLALYFWNLPNLARGSQSVEWTTMISFLNLGVVGLILATFTTRFIYPMISLEGRRFWILGTLPLARGAILWSKFLFALFCLLPPCVVLVLLSDLMLGVLGTRPGLAALHQLTMIAMCVGLSALAVGLGARFPDFREPTPSKIASGFGGTLTLVLSGVYIIGLSLLTAVPAFMWLIQDYPLPWSWEAAFSWQWWTLGHPGSLVLSAVVVVGLAATATWLPLKLGMDAFEAGEF